MKTIIWIIVTVAIVVGLIAFGAKLDRNNGNPNTNGNSTTTPNTNNPSSMIRVTVPTPNSTITSPLTLTGEARGNWYFEASFPVKLFDANGKMLVQHYAQAQGDWMTTDFVPFSSTLNFSNPTTPTGTLVLEKDNPSGLPENAAEIRIPVKFGASATNTQSVKLYYYNESKDKDANGNIICSAKGLEAVERTIPRTITPIQDTLKLLIKGELMSSESSRGISTEFPLQGLTINSASLNNGVLTLNMSDPQNKTSGGSCRVTILRAQIESTAKQFSGVTNVKFSPNTLFQP